LKLVLLIALVLLLVVGQNVSGRRVNTTQLSINTVNRLSPQNAASDLKQGVAGSPIVAYESRESQQDLPMPPVIGLSELSAHTENGIFTQVSFFILLLGLLTLAVLYRMFV
jgi:hypothetical protein